MENFKFNVSIILNAVELIKNNFEVKEEVKNFFLGTKQYIDLISDYMVEQGIMEEYVDLFNWTDPEIIFKKYVLVHEDAVEFDYAAANREDSLSSDRANIFFSVPCEFEIDKYIKVMDQGTDDSSEKPASNINGWKLTDDSCFQYSKKLYTENGEERWAFIEMVSIGDKFRVHADALKFSSYDNEHIETCIKLSYAGGLSQVKEEYPNDWQQISLECIFETDWDGYNQIFEVDANTEAEAYEIIKRVISDGGDVSQICKYDTQAYVNRQTAKFDGTEKILVEVYTETVDPELAGNTSIGHIEVEKNLLFKWFKEVLLPDYRSSSDTAEGLSDEAIFEDWLLEYLPEATVGLYDWIQEHKSDLGYSKADVENVTGDKLPTPAEISVDVTEIIWDLEPDEFASEAEYEAVKNNLPENVKIPLSELEETTVEDWLSNNYNYCVKSYRIDTSEFSVTNIKDATKDVAPQINEKKYKLHARVTREIKVTEEQMERLCNYLCGSTENFDITDIKEAFLKGEDSGDYEEGYIPQSWIQADFEQLDEASEIKMYFDENQCNFNDIKLY